MALALLCRHEARLHGSHRSNGSKGKTHNWATSAQTRAKKSALLIISGGFGWTLTFFSGSEISRYSTQLQTGCRPVWCWVFLCILSLFCFSVPVSPQRRVQKGAFSQITPACLTEHSISPVMFRLLPATACLAAARGGKNRRIGQGPANHHAGTLITRASLGTMR